MAVLLTCLAVSQASNTLIAIYCYIKCVSKPHHIFSVRATFFLAASTWIVDCIIIASPIISGFIKMEYYGDMTYICMSHLYGNCLKYMFFCILPLLFAPAIVSLAFYLFILVRHNRTLVQTRRAARTALCMAGLFFIFLLCFLPAFVVKLLIFRKWIKPSGKALRYINYFAFAFVAFDFVYYNIRIKSLLPDRFWKMFRSAGGNSPMALPQESPVAIIPLGPIIN